MSGATQSEIRLARIIDERELTRQKHESLLASVESRDDKQLTDTEREQVKHYREQAADFDVEIADLARTIEDTRKAEEESRSLRRAMSDGFAISGDGEEIYPDFYSYARDFVLTRCQMLATQWASEEELVAMRQRQQLLKRTPANTLSSNVAGLTPAQHINQIFQVINNSRPLVGTAQRVPLDRGQLTYPKVTTRPVVAVQSSEKTEAGNTGMVVDMQTTTASTYLGGGDLSWQAINWSTPDALQLWFNLAAADYALKTEQDAAQALQHSAFTFNINTGILGSTPTFAEFLAAVAQGASDVFTNSGRMADTIYMSVDRYWYMFGLTSAALPQFVQPSAEGVGPLRIVPSRGMDSGVAVVGDSSGLLVAETPGAPVELRVVEPAIGGVEVGIIGAFEAVVVDAGAFAMITTAS